MPNPIKYNSSTEDNALNVGNFWIGTGDVDKGPTSITGYYNGITPPPNGYTIYVHKLNQGPSIRIASDDSELIEITNDIASASYTTIIECFNYFEGQSDKMVTHQTMNFRITDGLVLDLDGNNIPSYPHNGTTWHDLSGNNFDYTIIGSPSYSDGAFTLTETTGFRASHNITNSTTATVVVFYKTTDGQELWATGQSNSYYLAASYGNNYYSSNAGSPSYYVDTTSIVNPSSYRNGKYHMWEAKNVNLSTWTRMWFWQYGSSWNMNGTVAKIMVYDRVLTTAESQQNYYQGPIVTGGLIRALDFSNLVSYEIGNSGGFDLTGNDTFDLFNTPTPVTDFGGGISCNNTDEFIALADKTPTDYVSVEVWFRRDNADSGENIIFNKENSWEMKESAGNLSWALMANNKSWFWYDSTANIDVGETVQFVLTYDGNYVKSYKNGELVQTYTYPSGGVLSSQNSCYPKLNSRSCSRTTPSSLGNMTYFQFRIYDRALSPDEVSKNYHATKYKFNHA